jgi:hypothetical protein
MLKTFAIAAFSLFAVTSCAAPAIDTSIEAARQEGLNSTPLSQGACDGVGQLLPGRLTPQAVTLGTTAGVIEASVVPAR